jgi:thymidylate synthase
MIAIHGENMDSIFRSILKKIIEQGRISRPRNMAIRELNAFGFQLENPRARLIYDETRKMNLMFALGELLWYIRGSNKSKEIEYYNKKYSNYSDDGNTLNGAYGRRIFSEELFDFSQWNACLNLLLKDPDTRQAVITIHNPIDLNSNSKDIPCTCYIQFLLRNNRLECIVNMRSNDIIWGTCYDVFSFTMMQELMANQLGIDIGPYNHFVGSMHLYDYHFDLAKQILSKNESISYSMPPMPNSPLEELKILLLYEEYIRKNNLESKNKLSDYWGNLRDVLYIHNKKKTGSISLAREKMNELPIYYKSLVSQFI